MDSSTSFLPETSVYSSLHTDLETLNGSLPKGQSEKSGSDLPRGAESCQHQRKGKAESGQHALLRLVHKVCILRDSSRY